MLRSRPAAALAALVTSVVLLAGCTSSATDDPTTTDGPSTSAPSASAPSTRSSTPMARPSDVGVDRTQRSDVRAVDALAALAVKGRAPRTGYSREQFGQAWTDDNDSPGGRNGCDTRNDVLKRDLTGDVVRPGTAGCVLVSGVLLDPYTAATIRFTRGEDTSSAVQIDHVVALSDAWQTGAQQLSPQRRRDLANDPLELLAVDGPTNQAKGDGDTATWLPPNSAYRCAYVARQIAVKRAYRLWVTAAERDAMTRVLRACPARTLPQEASTPRNIPTPVRTSRAPGPTAAPTRAATAAPAGCTTTPSGACIRAGQFCKRVLYGRTGVDADGVGHLCGGDTTRPRWQP